MSWLANYERVFGEIFQEEGTTLHLKTLKDLLHSLNGQTLQKALDETDCSLEAFLLQLLDDALHMHPKYANLIVAKVLKLDPDCVFAYEIKAALSPPNQRLAFYKEGIKRGWKKYGGNYRKTNKGKFWHFPPTKSLLRCMYAVAMHDFKRGKIEPAQAIWEQILELDEEDHMGVRYHLLSVYLHAGELDLAEPLFQRFGEDGSIHMTYLKILFLFLKNEIDEARSSLWQAFRLNLHLPNRLFFGELLHLEEHDIPDSYLRGSVEEAEDFIVIGGWHAWGAHSEALAWLKDEFYDFVADKSGPIGKEILDKFLMPLGAPIDFSFMNPFSPGSPLALNKNLPEAEVQQAPFLQLAYALLNGVLEKEPLKLTSRGNLPTKLVKEISQLGILMDWKESSVKRLRESHYSALRIVREVCQMVGFLRKRKNHLLLTKKGRQALENPSRTYVELLQAYLEEYDWSRNDYFPGGLVQNVAGNLLFAFFITGRKYYPLSDYCKFFSFLNLQSQEPLFHSFFDIIAEKTLNEPFFGRFILRFLIPFGFCSFDKKIEDFYDLNYFFFDLDLSKIRVKATNLVFELFVPKLGNGVFDSFEFSAGE
ncbi:MAG: hypothetical protein D6765_02045 [Bacteroidetes bacterium]|nr:MAG: hypothetical protein D6765_02045 [Bacteroidota bacterium]